MQVSIRRVKSDISMSKCLQFIVKNDNWKWHILTYFVRKIKSYVNRKFAFMQHSNVDFDVIKILEWKYENCLSYTH